MAIKVHFIESSIILYVLVLIFPKTNSTSQSEALLKLKHSFTNATLLNSWKPGTTPCAKGREWARVVCVNGVASSLMLGHLGLSGNINVDALASLPGLRSISLVSNRFSGSIPDFQRVGNLRGLFLSENRFSGEIPYDYFTNLSKLKKVWLSGNEFSGQIPSSLANLPFLIELHLEDNQFSGMIPPLVQPSLVYLNISNNRFKGEIPSHISTKFRLESSEAPEPCGTTIGKPCNHIPDKNVSAENRETHPDKVKYLWSLLPIGVVFLVMIVGIIVLKQRQDREMKFNHPPSAISSSVRTKDYGSSPDLESLGSDHRVASSSRSSEDIVMINDGIGEFITSDLMKGRAEALGKGTLGHCYMVTMADGLIVVVKRIKEVSRMEWDQFEVEVRKLASVKHKNVLPPMAYSYRPDKKLLVYEHQSNGSLLDALHGDHGTPHMQLNWPTRLKIIRGIVQGLAHIHAELSSQNLPHGNLKSSNVFLTSEYEALLVDYGFDTLITSDESKKTLAAYKAPEAILHNQISPKCDIYCLGLIILEILTRKCSHLNKPKDDDDDTVDIVQWAGPTIVEERQANLLDPQITGNNDCIAEVEEVLQIGIACVESNPDKRLDISQVVKMIECVRVEENSPVAQTAQSLSLHSDE